MKNEAFESSIPELENALRKHQDGIQIDCIKIDTRNVIFAKMKFPGGVDSRACIPPTGCDGLWVIEALAETCCCCGEVRCCCLQESGTKEGGTNRLTKEEDDFVDFKCCTVEEGKGLVEGG